MADFLGCLIVFADKDLAEYLLHNLGKLRIELDKIDGEFSFALCHLLDFCN